MYFCFLGSVVTVVVVVFTVVVIFVVFICIIIIIIIIVILIVVNLERMVSKQMKGNKKNKIFASIVKSIVALHLNLCVASGNEAPAKLIIISQQIRH